MIFFFISAVPAVLVMVVRRYWTEVGERLEFFTERQFYGWLGKGMLVPLLAWALVNSGWVLPPLTPQIHWLRQFGPAAGPGSVSLFLLPGVLTIATFWAAFSLGVLAATIALTASDRKEWLTVSLLMGLLALPFVWLLLRWTGWPGLGLAGICLLIPNVHCTAGLLPRKPPKPTYSRAIARIQMGKYNEAEWAVIEELERCEHDFEGWMMLADLYATRFQDLASAEETIYSLCAQPGMTGVQIATALHKLATWHLEKGENPAAARAAMQVLCEGLPDTHFARMARVRMEQMPASVEELRQQKNPRKIRISTVGDPLDRIESEPACSRESAVLTARQCVEQLNRNPNDVLAREEFARTMAEFLGKPRVGIEQLELLLAMPDQPESRRAGWMSLAGRWELDRLEDKAAGRQRLRQILREYPESVQAFAAQRRLSLLDFDERLDRRSPGELSTKTSKP
jgi:hypothetical protein